MKTKFALFLSMIILALPATAAKWKYVTTTSTDGDEHFIDVESTKVSRDGDVTVMGKTNSKKGKSVDLYLLWVSSKDCLNKAGTVWVSELSGAERYNFPFAEGAGNVGSEKGMAACRERDRLRYQSPKPAQQLNPASPAKSISTSLKGLETWEVEAIYGAPDSVESYPASAKWLYADKIVHFSNAMSSGPWRVVYIESR